jgi:hypothetical protein
MMMNKKMVASHSRYIPIYSELTGLELKPSETIRPRRSDQSYVPEIVGSASAGGLPHLQKLIRILGKEKMGMLLKISYQSRTAFHAACGKNKVAVMDFIYSNFGYDLEANCGSGVTPLFSAVASQSKDAAVWLLNHGAKKDHPAKCGLTPLEVAVERNLSEMLNILNTY